MEIAKIDEIVDKLEAAKDRRVLLHGLVQSGKTNVFLNVINKMKSKGYTKFFLITKSSLNLVTQTAERAQSSLNDINIYEMKREYENFTPYELDAASLFIVKKHLKDFEKLETFLEKYPRVKKEKTLIIIDEADEASIGFKKTSSEKEKIILRAICKEVEKLKAALEDCRLLDVTATPFVQYLSTLENFIPHSVVLLEPHSKYFGGSDLFLSDDLKHKMIRENYISQNEQSLLKKISISETNLIATYPVLTKALLSFIMGGSIRHIQLDEQRKKHFSMLCHVSVRKTDHDKFKELLINLKEELQVRLNANDNELLNIVREIYSDFALSQSIDSMPSLEYLIKALKKALSEYVKITIINSSSNSSTIQNGKIKNNTPFSIFVGSKAVERGITFDNLINFFYCRPLVNICVESIIQHMRIYGARDQADLFVTRMFAPEYIINNLTSISKVEETIRENIGVFEKTIKMGLTKNLQEDFYNILPALPTKVHYTNRNKIWGKMKNYKGYSRILPSGFNTLENKEAAAEITQDIFAHIESLRIRYGQRYFQYKKKEPYLKIPIQEAAKLAVKAYSNLRFFDTQSEKTLKSILFFLQLLEREGMEYVHLYDRYHRNRKGIRNIKREEINMTASDNSPDSGKSGDFKKVLTLSKEIPTLMLLHQTGLKENGFDDVPFFWPVFVLPGGFGSGFVATEALV